MTTIETEWAQWHTERERYYGDPLGWVSITGLYWLTEEFETVADLPGRWRADADAVYVEGIDGIERLEPVEGAPGLLVEDGDRRIEVIRRTGSVALRVHDPKSPHLQAYNGIPAYPPSEKWRRHQARSRRTSSRRPSRRVPSSRDSNITTTPSASSTSIWRVRLAHWSPSAARGGLQCCSPTPPAA